MALKTSQTKLDQKVLPTGGTPSEITTAGAATYTAAQVLSGFIYRDPSGGARSDVTPTIALLKAAMGAPKIGDWFDFVISNGADAAETITVTAGTGCTITTGSIMTIAQNAQRTFRVVLTGTSKEVTGYTLTG